MVMIIEQILREPDVSNKPQTDDFQDFLWIKLLRKKEDDISYLYYRLTQEQNEKEKYKRLYDDACMRCKGLEKQLELMKHKDRARGAQSFSECLKLGRDIGKLEAETEQVISQQKLISSLL